MRYVLFKSSKEVISDTDIGVIRTGAWYGGGIAREHESEQSRKNIGSEGSRGKSSTCMRELTEELTEELLPLPRRDVNRRPPLITAGSFYSTCLSRWQDTSEFVRSEYPREAPNTATFFLSIVWLTGSKGSERLFFIVGENS